jgi:hypothetical protein
MSSNGTAPLKPKEGLNGSPAGVRYEFVEDDIAELESMLERSYSGREFVADHGKHSD